MSKHVVVLPLSHEFQASIEQLHLALQAGSKQSLSRHAGELMTEVGCQTIDSVFKVMVERFLAVEGLPADKKAKLKESLSHIEDVKGIMRKYMGWALSKFSNERLTPVVSYFYQLIHTYDATPYLVIELSEDVAERAVSALDELKERRVNDIIPLIERLIEVTDVVVDKLIRYPMHLLKFNVVIEKTLSGVIKMTTSIAYKNLLKLGHSLDPLLYDTAADHLQQFLREK